MDFLKKFSKELSKMGDVAQSAEPPRYWHSSGNFVLNKIMSGNFGSVPGVEVPGYTPKVEGGLAAQGRICGLVGPSGSGKSFLLGNLIKNAQKDGAFVLVLDSEGALDNQYLSKIGVDVENNFMYVDVISISSVVEVVNSFLKNYKEEYASDLENAPHVFIALDSLDMLMTDTEVVNQSKGIMKGDQGQLAKQKKSMMRQFVQATKRLNVSMVVNGQVYAATQDQILAGEGKHVVNAAIRYALSQITILTNLKLKDKTTKDVTGIRLKAEGFKTRFTKPHQKITIEVPYETGMDPFSGLLEAGLSEGVIIKKGSRYALATDPDNSWYSKNIHQHAGTILTALDGQSLHVAVETEDGDDE